MAKKKRKHSPAHGGKTVKGATPISKEKRMKPLSRGLLITAVVLIALAEVLLRMELVSEQVNTVMYLIALVSAIAAVVVEFSGLGRGKMPMD